MYDDQFNTWLHPNTCSISVPHSVSQPLSDSEFSPEIEKTKSGSEKWRIYFLDRAIVLKYT